MWCSIVSIPDLCLLTYFEMGRFKKMTLLYEREVEMEWVKMTQPYEWEVEMRRV